MRLYPSTPVIRGIYLPFRLSSDQVIHEKPRRVTDPCKTYGETLMDTGSIPHGIDHPPHPPAAGSNRSHGCLRYPLLGWKQDCSRPITQPVSLYTPVLQDASPCTLPYSCKPETTMPGINPDTRGTGHQRTFSIKPHTSMNDDHFMHIPVPPHTGMCPITLQVPGPHPPVQGP